MPELPEVEAARALAERVLARRRIASVAARPDPVVFENASPRRIALALGGRRVQRVGRKGKHLWIELDRRPWPLLHFGMTGWLFAYRDPVNRPRHWRLELEVEGGMRLCFSDPRRFGRVRLQADPLNEPPVSQLGFDVLEGLPPAVTLAELLSRRRAPIKAVLLDQSLFAGVGNWIADEALYQAGIAPHRPAADLPLGAGVPAARPAALGGAPRRVRRRRFRTLPPRLALPPPLGRPTSRGRAREDSARNNRRPHRRLGPRPAEVRGGRESPASAQPQPPATAPNHLQVPARGAVLRGVRGGAQPPL